MQEIIATYVTPLTRQAITLWTSGGWGMLALALNAFILFAIGVNLWLRLKSKSYKRLPEKKWRRWITRPEEREGPIGDLIRFVMGASSVQELTVRFGELHTTELAPVNRELKLMQRAVTTAPLLGLLGTVTGMLTTFGALASGSGGQKTMDMVAGGISEALITTETGLLIALPGLFFTYHLTRQRDRYDAFLSHMESVCAQRVVRLVRGEGRRNVSASTEVSRTENEESDV